VPLINYVPEFDLCFQVASVSKFLPLRVFKPETYKTGRASKHQIVIQGPQVSIHLPSSSARASTEVM
jgi:hypothetical protein